MQQKKYMCVGVGVCVWVFAEIMHWPDTRCDANFDRSYPTCATSNPCD